MTSSQKPLLKRMLSAQWSFFWAGIAFGVAQIVYMLGSVLASLEAGKTPGLKPITVTTDLGKMFRGLELSFYNLFNLPDFQLYGQSIDGISSGGAFFPGVGWPIVGMMIGGWLVARVEKESRTWAYYPTRVLAISFIGGMLFSYGTRLAGGCTLNHLLGGVPLMNIHSFVTVIFMAIGGGLAFKFLGNTGMASYFKHQETKSYVAGNDAGESLTYRKGYQPMRRIIYWISLAFAVAFFGVAIYGGIFNPESLGHLKNGDLAAFGKSFADKGWLYVISGLIAGIIGGFGMAKSGFGTECALVSAEAGEIMKRDDSTYAKLGVPRITRTLMRSYLPMIGLMAAWVVTLGFIVVMWNMLDIAPKFSGSIKYQTTVGNIIGGLFLGAGAVMLIGCEIRSYMRIGMGYLNTWVGFMGFAFGYLPFTLLYDQHKAFFEQTLMVKTYHFYQLFAPENIGAQKVILTVWLVVLVAGLALLIRLGSRKTGASTSSIMHKNTEDLQTEIDAGGAKDGKYNGVDVPKPAIVAVPAE